MQKQIDQMKAPRRRGYRMSRKPVSEKKHRAVVIRARWVGSKSPDVGCENPLHPWPDPQMRIPVDRPVIVVHEVVSKRGNVEENGVNNRKQRKPLFDPLD